MITVRMCNVKECKLGSAVPIHTGKPNLRRSRNMNHQQDQAFGPRLQMDLYSLNRVIEKEGEEENRRIKRGRGNIAGKKDG